MLYTGIYYKNDVMAMKEVLKERLDNRVDGEELTEALVLIRTRAPDLESVRKLNCWACNIGDVNIVRHMPNLEVCSLTINKLTSLRDFSHCHNLQELYVRTNNIQHLSDIYYLKNLKKLRSLWLSENPCASKDNYRPTVLKVLPNLNKLDNVAVTEEEVARAQTEGDDLPIPEDFSFSAVLRETTLSSEYGTDTKKEENASVSSEKWARPRQKRQQKKREEYWREKRGGVDDSVKSGEDGGGCSMRSSSDSVDGEEVYSPTSSSRHEAVGQEHEEEEGDNYEKVDDGDDDDDDEGKKDTPSTKAKWALNIEILDSKTLDQQDKLELKVENLDNFMDYDKNDVDKMYTGGKFAETNLEEEKTCNYSTNENIHQNEDNQVQDVFVESSNVETEPSKVSTLLNSSVFHEGNLEVSNSTDSNKSLLVSDNDPVIKLMSVFSIDIAKMASVDFNTNANTDNAAQIVETKADQFILEDLNYTATHSFKVSEQTDTPLLDNIKLEDTLDVVDDQTIESKHIGDMEEKVKTELPDLAAQAAGSATSSWQPLVQSVSDVREPVNWEEYNRMRVQLGVEPVNRISITTRSSNSDTMRARNSNVLQAVLCLVKELDQDSLDIVATVVKARLENT